MSAKKNSDKKKGKSKKSKTLSGEALLASSEELKYRLGSAFWRERRNQDRTQDEVAETAGIKRQALGMIEAGKRMSNIAMLHRVAAALGVPLWKIFRTAEEMEMDAMRPALREKIASDDD